MLTPYEVAVKSVIPTLRAMLARELLLRGFTQSQIAQLMGITQPAVSNYVNQTRGRMTSLDSRHDVAGMIRGIAREVEEGANPFKVVEKLRDICDYVMKKGYMCEVCKNIDDEYARCVICLD